MSPDDPRHGTYAGGRIHRADDEDVCPPCRHAEARYQKERELDALAGRARTLPAIGTQRRLQALVALGHTFARIAQALDITQAGAHHLARKNKTYVRATTAAKVLALYNAWSMKLPPSATSTDRKNATYARTVAAKHDWSVPLAWEGLDIDDPDATPYATTHTAPDPDDIDPVVIERILAGDTTLGPTATYAERVAIVAAWTERTGRSLADLGRATGWKPERYTTRPSTTHTKENTAA